MHLEQVSLSADPGAWLVLVTSGWCSFFDVSDSRMAVYFGTVHESGNGHAAALQDVTRDTCYRMN